MSWAPMEAGVVVNQPTTTIMNHYPHSIRYNCAIAIQDSSYDAYNSLVILQPLVKPIETIAVIVLSEQLKGRMHKIPVISRFLHSGM
jgi:hypothetical protein